jgi:hypothetical protein
MKDELEEESRPGGKTAYRWKFALPISDPSHPIHHARPIAMVVETEDLKPKYGYPDPLNQRGKNGKK